MKTHKSSLFIAGIITVLAVATSCQSKKQPMTITFSGAVMTVGVDESMALRVIADSAEAHAAGIAGSLSQKIFNATVIECPNSSDNFYFTCKQDRNCTESCVIRSARHDGSNERVEEPDADGRVIYLPGRIYWCPCE